MKIENVLITGASPDHTNRNSILRSFVVEGFQQLLGTESVFSCPLQYASACARTERPDLILCFGSCMPDDTDYSEIKKECETYGILLVFWLHDDPYEFDYNYKICGIADVVFSNDKWASLHYDHDRAFHMPLAASKTAHWREINPQKDLDIFFCGVAFPNRIQLIRDLMPVLTRCQTKIYGDGWPEQFYPIAQNERLQNSALSDYYSQSIFTLNMGRDFNYSNNRYHLTPSTPGPRTFEAAMAGTVQLFFVESLEIEDYFVDRKEILLFNSPEDLAALLEKSASGEISAQSISVAAQQKAIEQHTYFHRARSILDIIESIRKA